MSQQTVINGNRYSFTSVTVEANTIQGGTIQLPKGVLQAINWEAAQEPGIVDGNQIQQVGRTSGYGRGTGDFEILLSEADDFERDLTGNGVFPTMSVDFSWVVSHSVNDIDMRTSVLRGCRISRIAVANAKGNDATMKKYTMTIAQIIENGIPAFADPAI